MRSGKLPFNRGICAKAFWRFWPIWALYLVGWLFAVPFTMVNRTSYMEALAGAPDREAWQWFVSLMEGLTRGAPGAVAACMALFAAMAMCSHLYSTRSANFMGALPVRRSGMFWSHYLAGLLGLVAPVLITAVITFALSLPATFQAAGDIMELKIQGWCALGGWLLLMLVSTFLFYSMAMAVGMFTGHLLALPFLYGAVNMVAAVSAHLLSYWFQWMYYGFYQVEIMSEPVLWCTPVAKLGEAYILNGAWSKDSAAILLSYTVCAAALLALALFLYRRRTMERAGDVIAIGILRPAFRACAGVLTGLCFGTVTAGTFSLSAEGMLFWAVVWGLVGSYAAQMFMDKSFRVLGKWKNAAATTVFILVLFAVVRLDVFGFETRVPQAEQVTSVEVHTYYLTNWEGGLGNGIQLDDPEQIAQVIALHKTILDEYEQYGASGRVDGQDCIHSTNLRITYNLEGGGTLSRLYTLYYPYDYPAQGGLDPDTPAGKLQVLTSREDVIELCYGLGEIERLEGAKASLSGSYIYILGPDDTGDSTMSGMSTSEGRGDDSAVQMSFDGDAVALMSSDAQRLLAAYRKDVEEGNFPPITLPSEQDEQDETECPYTVEFIWNIGEGNAYHSTWINQTVPESAVNTLAVIEEILPNYAQQAE